MNDFASTNDHLSGIEEPKKLPSAINVLTILTFVGCGLEIISRVFGFAMAKANLEKIEKLQGSPEYENLPDFAKKMYGPEMLEITRKSLENRVPILLITLVAVCLCIYGAMQMRKLAKQGYYIYLIGEILPVITIFIFLGAAAFTPLVLAGLIIPVVFIIMYSVQLKHLH